MAPNKPFNLYYGKAIPGYTKTVKTFLKELNAPFGPAPASITGKGIPSIYYGDLLAAAYPSDYPTTKDFYFSREEVQLCKEMLDLVEHRFPKDGPFYHMHAYEAYKDRLMESFDSWVMEQDTYLCEFDLYYLATLMKAAEAVFYLPEELALSDLMGRLDSAESWLKDDKEWKDLPTIRTLKTLFERTWKKAETANALYVRLEEALEHFDEGENEYFSADKKDPGESTHQQASSESSGCGTPTDIPF